MAYGNRGEPTYPGGLRRSDGIPSSGSPSKSSVGVSVSNMS